jgi:hypothetical protein
MVPNQTPQKENQSYGNQEIGGNEDGTSPPFVNSSATPPPHPGASRVQGVKQFSKPMKITKKKFVMAPPDPSSSGFVKPKPRDVDPYDHLLNAPYQEPAAMNRDSSKSSLMKRDGSMNKLVEEKQLGPQKMIKKVNQQVGYNQWN